MKITYSQHALAMIEERKIKITWIEDALRVPDRVRDDPSDEQNKHYLAVVNERENRVLRVVVNVTVEPIHVVSVFFDRRLRGKL